MFPLGIQDISTMVNNTVGQPPVNAHVYLVSAESFEVSSN